MHNYFLRDKASDKFWGLEEKLDEFCKLHKTTIDNTLDLKHCNLTDKQVYAVTITLKAQRELLKVMYPELQDYQFSTDRSTYEQ